MDQEELDQELALAAAVADWGVEEGEIQMDFNGMLHFLAPAMEEVQLNADGVQEEWGNGWGDEADAQDQFWDMVESSTFPLDFIQNRWEHDRFAVYWNTNGWTLFERAREYFLSHGDIYQTCGGELTSVQMLAQLVQWSTVRPNDQKLWFGKLFAEKKPVHLAIVERLLRVEGMGWKYARAIGMFSQLAQLGKNRVTVKIMRPEMTFTFSISHLEQTDVHARIKGQSYSESFREITRAAVLIKWFTCLEHAKRNLEIVEYLVEETGQHTFSAIPSNAENLLYYASDMVIKRCGNRYVVATIGEYNVFYYDLHEICTAFKQNRVIISPNTGLVSRVFQFGDSFVIMKIPHKFDRCYEPLDLDGELTTLFWQAPEFAQCFCAKRNENMMRFFFEYYERHDAHKCPNYCSSCGANLLPDYRNWARIGQDPFRREWFMGRTRTGNTVGSALLDESQLLRDSRGCFEKFSHRRILFKRSNGVSLNEEPMVQCGMLDKLSQIGLNAETKSLIERITTTLESATATLSTATNPKTHEKSAKAMSEELEGSSKRIVNYMFEQLKGFLKTMSITVICFIFLAVLFYWVSKSKITAALAASLITAWGLLFGSELCQLAGWAMFWLKAKLAGKTLSQAVLETKPTGDKSTPPVGIWSGDLKDPVDYFDKEPDGIENENSDYYNNPFFQTAGFENIELSTKQVGSDGVLSWTSILMTCLFGAMSILVIKALPSDKDTEGFMKRCTNFPRAIKGVKEMIELFSETTEWCQKFFQVKIMKQNPVVAMDGGITEIQEWAEKVKKYTTLEYFDKIATHMQHAQEVCSLYHQGMGFCRNKHMYSPKAKEILTACLATSKTLWNKGLASIARTQSSRPKPPCLVLWGDTSVGKTGMVNAITLDLLKEDGVTAEQIQQNGIACYRYNRDVDQEFWDGYKDQSIILYDDGLQKRDTVASPSLEITEYIHGINTFARPLHMAALEDKQNTVLRAKAFIITSNASKIQAESIVCPAAVASRFSHVFLVRIKPEYVKLKNGSPRLDPEKALRDVSAPVNLNIYDLEECDINADGQFVPNGRHISYFQMAREMRAALRKSLTQHKDMDEFLEDYMKMDGNVEDQYNEKYSQPVQTGFGSWMAHKTLNLMGYSDEDIVQNVANAREYLGMDETEPLPPPTLEDENEVFEEATGKVGGVKLVKDVDGNTEFVYDSEISELWFEPTWNEKIRCQLSNMMNSVTNAFTKYWEIAIEWVETHPMMTTLLAVTGFLGMVSLLWKFWKSDRVVKKLVNEPVDIQLPNPALDSHLPALAAALKAGMTIEGHYFVRVGGQSHAHNNWDTVEWALEKEEIPEGSTLVTPQELVQCSGSHAKKEQRMQRLKLRSGSHAKKEVRQQRVRMRGASPIVSTDGNQVAWSTFFDQCGLTPEELADMLFMTEKDDMKFYAFDDECGLDYVMPENVTFKTPDGNYYVCPIQRGFECENLSAKIIRNMSVLGMVTPEGKTRTVGNVLFVQGTICLIPYHYVTTLSAMKDEIKVFIRPIKSDKKIWIDRPNFFGGVRIGPSDQKYDAYLFDAGVQHPQRRSLLKTWMNIRDFDKIDNQQCRLITRSVTDFIDDEVITYKDGLADTICLNRTLECGSTFTDEFQQGRKPETITYRNLIVSDFIKVFPTQCGSPLLIDNDLVKGKICGILNLSLGTNARSSAYAPVALEDLEEGLKHFKSIHSKIYPGEAKMVDEVQTTAIPLQCSFLQEGAAKPIASNRVSSIVKTKIHNQVWQATNRPAALHRTFDPATDPMYKGLEKCTVEVPLIDKDILSVAAESYGDFIMNQHHPTSAPDKFQEVLDFETAVVGKPGLPFYEAINRSTSPGFPWVHERPSKLPGKRPWLGDDEDFKLDSVPAQHLKIVCQEVVDLAKQGIRDTILFSDTLKDEVRPNEKVDALKTRVFAAGPMHFTIPCRQYFLPFSAYLQSNRIRNGVAVGINPYDAEWHELASHINVHPNVIAGDFSNYDGSIPSQILTAAFDIVINKFYYNSSEEDKMVRATIAAMVTRSEHLCDGIVYQWDHSLPSGNPLTAIMNSIVNNIVIRMAWLSETGRPIGQFNKHVYMIAFGDDNVISVSNEMIEEFNFPIIARGLAKLGMTMTDERKTGEVILFRKLEEVQFLKRGFFFREDLQRYVCPLDIESIMKMTNWIHKTPTPDQVLAQNIETIWRELSLHPKELFNMWTKIIRQVTPACVFQRALIEPTYEAYTRLWLSGRIDKEGIWFCSGELEHFTRSFGNSDIVEVLDDRESSTPVVPYLGNNNATPRGTPTNKCTKPSLKRFGRRTRRNYPGPATQTMMTSSGATADDNPVASDLSERPDESTTHDGPGETTIEHTNAAGGTPLKVDAQEIVHITESTDRIKTGYVRNPRNPGQLSGMLDTSVMDYTEQSIKTFLQTAVEIGNFSWTTSTAQLLSFDKPKYTGATSQSIGVGSPYLFSYNFPQHLLSQHPEISQKLNYMSELRCDFVVRVVLNVQPFQSGGLRLFGVPFPNLMKSKADNLYTGPFTTITSIPGQTLNIFNTQVIEYRMKPIGPYLFYDLVQDTHTWWTFNVACLSELGDPTGTGKIEGTVYAYFDNIDMRFRTGAPNAVLPTFFEQHKTTVWKDSPRKNKKMIDRDQLVQCMEANAQAATGTLSKVTGTISSIGHMAAMIPGIGQFAEAAADAADMIGGVAAQFGHSKPTSSSDYTKARLIQGDSFLSTNGQFVGHSLATVERNSLDPMDGAGLQGLDEGAFRYIAQQPAIIDWFTWATSDSPGTGLYLFTPSPKEMWVGDTDSPKAMAMPPFVMAMSPFNLYNCSWRVHLEAFKAGPHSGKMEIMFIPRWYGSFGTIPLINTNTTLKWIWDLKDSATFDVVIPYVNYVQWMRNPSFEQYIGGHYDEAEISPGTFVCRVLNTLTTPAVCAPKIHVTVTVFPDSDLVLGGGISTPELIPMELTPTTKVDKSEDYEEHPITQCAGVKGNGQIGLSEYLRSEYIINKVDLKPISITANATTTGEQILSVHALIKRFLPGRSFSTTGVANNVIRMQPNGPVYSVTGASTSLSQFPDWINAFAAIYNFRRGGMRVNMIVYPDIVGGDAYDTKDRFTRIVVSNYLNESETAPFIGWSAQYAASAVGGFGMNSGELPIYQKNEGIQSLEVPYYSRFHCLLNVWGSALNPLNGKFQSLQDAYIPSNEFYIFPNGDIGAPSIGLVTRVYRAARDDFEFSSYSGVPVFVYTTLSIVN